MASLAIFPNELILSISECLDSSGNVAVLTLTCRTIFHVTNHEWYRRYHPIHIIILFWASDPGRPGTVLDRMRVLDSFKTMMDNGGSNRRGLLLDFSVIRFDHRASNRDDPSVLEGREVSRPSPA